jgi:hypothetical protein
MTSLSSGRKPLTIAFVLGVLGSAGGFLSFLGWAFIFILGSPGSHGENAPVYTPLQVLVLTGIGIASVLGLVGSILSRTYVRTGGIVMLAAAGTGLAALPYVFSGSSATFIVLSLMPSYGWWAIVLLFGGLFGTLTRRAGKIDSGTPDPSNPPSKSSQTISSSKRPTGAPPSPIQTTRGP